MRVFEQIFFHVTGIGPAFGQGGYFQKQAPEQIPLAVERFKAESARVMTVLDGFLASRKYTAGKRIHNRRHCPPRLVVAP